MKKEDLKVADFFGRGQKNKKEKLSGSSSVVKKKGTQIKTKTKSRIESKTTFKIVDDLTKINGVGPVTANVLYKAGIVSFADLASAKAKELRKVISDVRGSHEPVAWIKQSKKMVPARSVKVTKNKPSSKTNSREEHVKKVSKVVKVKKSKKIVSTVSKKVPEEISKLVKMNPEQKKGVLTKIVNVVLVGLFFGSSLFFTNQTFQGVNFEKSVFFYLMVSVATGLAAVKFLSKRNIRISKTPFDKTLVAFILIYGISVWFSVDRWHSFMGFFSDPSRGLIFVVAMIVVFYLVLSNFTTQTAKKALTAIVVAIVFVSIYTLVSGLGLIPASAQIFVPFSLIGSLGGLTTLLSAGVPLLMISYLLLKKWRYRKVAVLFQGILIASLWVIAVDLMMLKVFVSWTALLGGLVVFMFLLANKNGKEIGNKFGRSVVFTMLVVFILLSGWAKSDYHNLMPVSPGIGLPTEVQIGLPVTFGIVKNSLTSDWKQILIGSGPASFGYDFAKFSPRGTVSPTPTIEYLYQGEGVLAEAIPTIGIIGSSLVLLLGIIFIIQVLRVLNIQSRTRIYFVGLFVASIILLMNGVSSQTSGGLLIFSVLLLSLTVFFMLKNSKGDKKYYNINLKGVTVARFGGALIGLVFLVGSLGGGIYVAKAYLADTYFKQALLGDDVEKKKQQIINVIRMRPEEGVYYTKLGQSSLALLSEKRKSGEEIGVQDMKIIKEGIVSYVKKGASLMPSDVKTQRFLATIYEAAGIDDVSVMKEVYENIIELDPNNIQYYVKIGDLCLFEFKTDNNNEKFDEALEWYKEALKVQPRVGVVYDRIATAYYQKGNLDRAIENIARATEVTPNNISYRFTSGVLYQLRGGENDVAMAEQVFRTLLTAAPRNIDILTQLGSLYEQTGHIDEAKKQYEQIISIVGDNEKLKKVSDVFRGFINNLDEGKLNIKNSSTFNVVDDKMEEVKEEVEGDSDEEKVDVDEGDVVAAVSVEPEGVVREMITITVGLEGPINVRSEGSLSGIKLTKIEVTGEFEKIGENDEWVQIIIPAGDGQEVMEAWVHGKFVTE